MNDDFWSATVTFDGDTVTRRKAATRLEAAGVPLAETTAALLAGAATFADGKWEPSTYLRDGKNRKKGEPCERHSKSGKVRVPAGKGEDAAEADTPAGRKAAADAVAFGDAVASGDLLKATGAIRDAGILGIKGIGTAARMAMATIVERLTKRVADDPRLTAAIDIARRAAEGTADGRAVYDASEASNGAVRRHNRRWVNSSSEKTLEREAAMYAAQAISSILGLYDNPVSLAAQVSSVIQQTAVSDALAAGNRVHPDATNNPAMTSSLKKSLAILQYCTGNPFRPTPVHKDAEATAMAKRLEEDGDAVTLAALADKQEENGRQEAADMLRSRPYVKGCHVVRQILGA